MAGGGALSAGTVSMPVRPDATGFGSKLALLLKGETGGLGAAIGGPLMAGLKTFAAPIAAVMAGMSVGKFAADSIKSFNDLAGSVKSMARLAGGSVEQVSGLRGAMQLSGVDADAASGAITIFSKNLGNTVGNAAKTADMVAKLGGSFTDAHGAIKPMSEILPGLADKFKTMPDGAEKTALAVQLFGRSGAQMVPFLNKGSGGIAELTAKAKEMGLVLDDASMKGFVDAKVSARNYAASIQGLKVTLGSELVPIMTAVSNVFRDVMTPVILAATKGLADHRESFQHAATAIAAFGGHVRDAAALVKGAFTGLGADVDLGGLTNPLISIGAMLRTISDGAKLVKGSFTGLGADVDLGKMTNPLIDFGAGLRRVADMVKPAIAEMWASAKPILGALGAAFVGLLPTLGPLVPQIFSLVSAFSPMHLIFKAIQPILPQLITTFATLAGVLAGALGAAMGTLMPVLTQLAGSLSTTLATTITALVPVVLQLVQAIGPILGQVLTTLMPIVAQLAAQLVGQLANVITMLVPIIVQLVGAIGPMLGTVLAAIMPLVGIFANYISDLLAAVMPLIPTVLNLVMAFLPLVAVIVNLVSQLLPPIIKLILAILPPVMSLVTGLVGFLVPVINTVIQVITWLITKLIAMPSPFQSIINVVNAVGSAVGSVFGAIGQVIEGGFSGVVNFVKGIFNTITGLVNGVIDGINSATSLAGVIGVHIGAIPHLPRLAQGATILPTPGGTIVRVAEAGKAESVVDTGKLNALLDRAGAGTASMPDTITLVDQQGSFIARMRVEAQTAIADVFAASTIIGRQAVAS